MLKVKKELSIGKYKVLSLNGSLPLKPFKIARIKNEDFLVTIPYDLKDSIAIESNQHFIDEVVEFI